MIGGGGGHAATEANGCAPGGMMESMGRVFEIEGAVAMA